jgi:hypothetical protein
MADSTPDWAQDAAPDWASGGTATLNASTPRIRSNPLSPVTAEGQYDQAFGVSSENPGQRFKREATAPIIPIPKLTINPDDSKTAAVGKEAVNLALGIPEFIESPVGLVTTPLGAAGGTVGKIVQGAFAADAAKSVGEGIIDAHKNWDNYTPAQKAAAVTDIVGSGLMTGLMAKGAGGDFVESKIAPARFAAKELARHLDNTSPEVPDWAAQPVEKTMQTGRVKIQLPGKPADTNIVPDAQKAVSAPPVPPSVSESKKPAEVSQVSVGDEVDHPMVGKTVWVEQKLTSSSPSYWVPVTVESVTRGEDTRGGSQTVTIKTSNGVSVSRNAGKQSDTAGGGELSTRTVVDGILNGPNFKKENPNQTSEKTPAPAENSLTEDQREAVIKDAGALSAVQDGKEYKPAIRTAAGKVYTDGEDHNAIYDTIPKEEQNQAKSPKTNGYVDKDGNFLTLFEVAKREMAKKENTGLPKKVNVPRGTSVPTNEDSGALAGSPTAMKFDQIDQERAKRGLPAITKPETVSDQQIAEKAISEMDKNPNLATDLVKELKGKPRTIDAWENQVLLLHKIDIRNRLNKAAEESAQAYEASKSDPSKSKDATAASVQANALSEQLNDVETASRLSGSERGRALRSLQIMANEDYSLAGMEARVRAAKGGEPITSDERAQLKKTADDYAAKNAQLEQHLAEYKKKEDNQRTALATDAVTKTATSPYPPGIIKAAEKIVSRLDKSADAARARIKQKLARTSAGVDPTLLADAAIIGASHIAHVGLDFAKWSDTMVGELGDWIKPHLEGIFKKSQDLTEQEAGRFGKAAPRLKSAVQSPLDSVKKNLQKSIDEYKRRLEDQDFSKRSKSPVVLDKVAQRLTAEKEAIVKKYKSKLRAVELANRPNIEKAFDFASNVRRFSVLSGVNVLGKLAAYSATKVPTMALGELAGKALKLPGLRDIASRAPSEGESSLAILSRSVAKGFTKGIEDAWQTLRTGSSELKKAYSSRIEQGWEWYNIPQTIHEVIKSPLRRIAFETSLAKRMNFAAKHGADTTDPMTQLALAKDAYLDSDRALLLEKNKVADAINGLFKKLEKPSSATGHPTHTGKVLATVGRVELPILTVPFNYLKQTLENAFGLITGTVKYRAAVKRGLENLKPEEADAIARHFKYGSIGAGMLLWGFFDGYNNGGSGTFGGFYQKDEKRRQDQAGVSGARVGGHNISGLFLHNPMISVAQFGHTIGAIAASKTKKYGEKGITAGIVAGLMGLLNESPIGNTVEIVSTLSDPRSEDYAVGTHVKSLLIPELMQEIAQYQDTDTQGTPIKRDPHGVVQYIESGIPYLREGVPVKIKPYPKGRESFKLRTW